MVCLVDDLLPGESKMADVNDRMIGLFTVDGEFQPGDVIELEADEIGVLRNRVVAATRC